MESSASVSLLAIRLIPSAMSYLYSLKLLIHFDSVKITKTKKDPRGNLTNNPSLGT